MVKGGVVMMKKIMLAIASMFLLIACQRTSTTTTTTTMITTTESHKYTLEIKDYKMIYDYFNTAHIFEVTLYVKNESNTTLTFDYKMFNPFGASLPRAYWQYKNSDMYHMCDASLTLKPNAWIECKLGFMPNANTIHTLEIYLNGELILTKKYDINWDETAEEVK